MTPDLSSVGDLLSREAQHDREMNPSLFSLQSFAEPTFPGAPELKAANYTQPTASALIGGLMNPCRGVVLGSTQVGGRRWRRRARGEPQPEEHGRVRVDVKIALPESARVSVT